MGFLIVLLTVALVLDCIILIFLVLIQLPKKEAGAGLAFGAGATDALFGAGSGTVLSKITKYAAGIFFGLAVVLSLLHKSQHNRSIEEFQKGVTQGLPARAAAPSVPGSTSASTTSAPGTNVTLPLEATNTPAISTNLPPSTNAPK